MRARDTQHANYRRSSRVFKSVLGTARTFESTRTYKKLLTDISWLGNYQAWISRHVNQLTQLRLAETRKSQNHLVHGNHFP